MEVESAATPSARPWWARAARALQPLRASSRQPFVRLATSEGAAAGAPPAPHGPTSDGDTHSVLAPSPEDSASFVARLLFTYVSPLVKLGGARPLQTADLWPVSPRDGAATVGGAFRATLAATATPPFPQGRLARALAAQYGRPFAVAGGIKLFHDGVMFLSPAILRRLLRTHGDRATAAALALALAAAGALECLTVNAYFHILFRISLHARAGECLGEDKRGAAGSVQRD